MQLDALRVYERLLAVELEKMDQQLELDLQRALSMLSAKGLLGGSAGMFEVSGIATRTIPIDTQTALNILLRSISAHGEAITSSNIDGIKDVLTTHINTRLAHYRAQIKETPPFRNTHISEQFLAALDKTADQEKRRVLGELDLIAASNKTHRSEAAPVGTSSFIINAPVGVIQTGPGSYGVAFQHIDSDAKEHIESALKRIEEAIASDRTIDDPSLSDTVELINDARGELQKEKPNPTKIRALVSGIGSAIAYIPKLRTAYETLKWAAAFAGITLP